MNSPTVKYNVFTNSPEHPNEFLSVAAANSKSLLINQAGKKASPNFQKNYCEKFLKKYFPKIQCPTEKYKTWATFSKNDTVDELTETWIEPTYELDLIPTQGEIEHDAWSDDYWRTKWGQTAYRYGANQLNPVSYNEAIKLFNPVGEWTGFNFMNPEEIAKKILLWSPAEKYDLTVGDTDFSLTHQQKKEGQDYLNDDGDVEGWMGLCHGWAPAALMTARPRTPVIAKGSENIDVTWYPNDIKAMITLAWANGNYKTNFIGGRCDVKHPETLSNGRLKQQDCFDTNPATFHLALGNLIGRAKTGFVFDKTFDYEVWNQPVIAYETTYYNPLDTKRRSKEWREVAVSYSWRFKSQDRFQNPLSRGKIKAGTDNRDDSEIKYIVGAITSVIYLAEVRPEHSSQIQDDRMFRETYTYDLEIENINGNYVASGGEWHENSHPDFLWIPQKDSIPTTTYDKNIGAISVENEPSPLLTKTAIRSSKIGSPLCGVLKSLIERSTGTDSYLCP